jgi:hypothetical protein
MKFTKIATVVLIVGSLLAYAGTLFVLNTYPGKAKFIQRVEKNEGADLFGESGTPIGSPQLYIIDDPKAFTGKKTANGAEEVDEKYLREHNLYPLQLQSLRFVAKQVQLVAGAVFLAGLAGLVMTRFKRVKTAQ